ncbi:MAG: signal peptidase II, partial [Dehalococcoidales bacterium]|nr:signal peptidase II [Dehalococcoidales bacterium]
MKEFSRRGAVFLLVGSLVVAMDQVAKYIVKKALDVGESFQITSFFQFTHVHNTGAAFSVFREHTFLLSIFSMIGIAIILFLVFYLSSRIEYLRSTPAKISLGLIFGGTLGNLIDRLSYGYVIDFIDFSFFATFNVADSAISVGAAVLALSYIR